MPMANRDNGGTDPADTGPGFVCAAVAVVLGVFGAAAAHTTSMRLGVRKRSPTDQTLRKLSSDRALEIERYREEEKARVETEVQQRKTAQVEQTAVEQDDSNTL